MKALLRLIPLLLVGPLLLVLPSCDIINPDEVLPVYITVEAFSFETDPGQGVNTSQFTDGWVFVNDQLVGTYELPATFPVFQSLAPGDSFAITVAPGIKEDGIASTRGLYSVCRAYETIRYPEPLDTITLSPSTRYLDQIDFPLVEDFEIGNTFTSTDDSYGDFILVDGAEAFEGGRSLGFTLDSAGFFFHGNSELKELPGGSAPVFLEMDYKCNQEFDVFLNAITTMVGGVSVAQYLVTVTAKDDWNKIYIRLNDDITKLPNSNYQIAFRAFGNEEGIGEIFLDNIKLVHF